MGVHKAVAEAVVKLNERFGDGAVMRLGKKAVPMVDVIPSGSIGLDLALGCRGYPKGRIIEIYGPESSGKTTLALHAAANVQRAGGIAAIVDAEHALDMGYAGKLGVNVNDLYVAQPDYGEQALEIVDGLIDSQNVGLIIVDSVAALTPKAEIDGDFGRPGMGEHARLMSQAMRKLTATAHRTGTTLIFINQLRSKIGVIFGSPEVTTGGNALKFYASVRLDVRRREAVKQAAAKGEEPEGIGNITEVKVVKNKMAPPFKSARFEIHYGKGIDRAGDALSVAVNFGIIEKSGNWYAHGGERLGNGFYNAAKALEDWPDMLDKVTEEIYAKVATA